MSAALLEATRWKIGDRVTRPVFMDDGTWLRCGDTCLPGPLKHGVVVDERSDGERPIYTVRWDDGAVGRFLWHGLDAESAETEHVADGEKR